MMKKILICAGLLGLGVSTAAAAQSSLEEVKGYLNGDIRFTLNSAQWTPKSSEGQIMQPLIVDGYTYLPIRAVAEAVGLEVGWSEQDQTVELKRKTSAPDPSMPYNDSIQSGPDILSDFDFTKTSSDRDSEIVLNQSIMSEQLHVNAKRALNGICSTLYALDDSKDPGKTSIEFELQGAYKKLTGFVGMHTRSDKYQDGGIGIMQVYGDNRLIAEYEVEEGKDAQDVALSVAQVEKLKLVFTMEKGKGKVDTIDFGDVMVSR